MLESVTKSKNNVYLIIKRVFDLIFSLIVFIMLSPLFFITCCLLAFFNKGAIFFIQPRPGYKGRIFKILKFKSMNDKKDENGELLPFDQRITKVGALIRKYSLDEIPQLLNVILGDMSLIGPRPLLTKYLPLYNDFQKRRHEVKPGITGWAQVNGRNAITWKEKFALDIWYVDNISFSLDFRILLMTFKKVLVREGVNSQDNLNMPEFMGTENE